MNTLQKLFIAGAVIGMLLALFLVSKVSADEHFKLGGSGYQCAGEEENRWKVESGNTATLPEGYEFGSVIVKDGQDCIPVYPTNEDGCYEVDIDGRTVTVTGTGEDGCTISHLEGTYILSTTPTPTVTPDPTVTVTPTPTPTMTPTPTVTPTPEVPHPQPCNFCNTEGEAVKTESGETLGPPSIGPK